MKILSGLALLATAVLADQTYENCEWARILGATYAGIDVTGQVANDYNHGIREWTAETKTFFEAPADVQATLVIVYEKCGNVGALAVPEGESISIEGSA